MAVFLVELGHSRLQYGLVFGGVMHEFELFSGVRRVCWRGVLG
jgi:hypothetical protein